LAGADVKDAQAQMHHSRASTTLDIYQQFVPECRSFSVAVWQNDRMSFWHFRPLMIVTTVTVRCDEDC
jgi:hypothetical protein